MLETINKYAERMYAIGERIRSERKLKGMSQIRLAEKMSFLLKEDVGQTTVSSWEKGAIIPPVSKLVCLSEVFGCDVGYLLGDYDERSIMGTKRLILKQLLDAVSALQSKEGDA